jgi:hypothetical protein
LLKTRGPNINLNRYRIGFDLDNTLIDYAPAFPEILEQHGLDPQLSRDEVRQLLQSTDGNDFVWQEIQSKIYTIGLKKAQIARGALECISFLQESKCEVFVVSHKTKTTQPRFGGVELHSLVHNWLENSEIPINFEINQNLYFRDSLEAKVQQIQTLKLDLFVDDLHEVVNHSNFPRKTLGWHYTPGKLNQDKNLLAGDFFELLRYLNNES